MSDDSMNRTVPDHARMSRDYERRTRSEPFGVAERECAASVHEGASSSCKVREYIAQRKHASR